jgi:hypothetical protein
MTSLSGPRPISIWVISLIAIAFGLLTLRSGGMVLFVDGPAREQAGNYVPFVLWFNFLAGFVYVIAGAGLWMRRRWAVWLAVLLAVATLLVFAAFGLHVWRGGLFEARTVAAMTLRSVVWLLIAVTAYRKILSKSTLGAV